MAFLSWPNHVLTPGADIDTAWQVALQMGADRHIDFGTQFVLNGGPLEFVLHPMVLFAGPAVVGALYLLATQLALGLSLVWVLRRNLPTVAAVLLAYVVATLDANQFVPAPEPIFALAALWCLVSLGDDRPPFVWPLLVYGGAIASALAFLIQFSEGFQVLVMCSIAVLAQPAIRRRGIIHFAGTFVAVLAALWLATGQGIGNFDDYVRTAFSILSQWSTALPYDDPAVGWVRPYALVVIAASLGAVYLGTRGLPRLRRGAAFLIVGLFDFSAWKHGFVINTATYAALFTWLMLMPWLAFRWRGRELGVALGAIVTLVVFFYVVTDHRPSELTRPVARVGDARDQLETLLLPGPRGDARRYARDYLLNAYQLDPKTLSLLRGRSVLAYPWDTTLIWAYGLDWYPLPVFPYLAYAPRLDRLDATAMESPSGPELILRHRPCGATYMPPFVGCEPWVANGPTFLPHEAPEATIAMFCNFEPIRTTARFQILERVPNRCGEPRLLSSQTVDALEDSSIPAPPRDSIVFARIDGLEPRGLERLRTLLYRAVERVEIFDDAYRYRVVAGTMPDGVILRVSPEVDFPYPFPVAPSTQRISFGISPGFGIPTGDYQIEYFALPVRRSQGRRQTGDRSR